MRCSCYRRWSEWVVVIEGEEGEEGATLVERIRRPFEDNEPLLQTVCCGTRTR